MLHTIACILKDFGGSFGEYALEPNVLKRFKKAANTLGIEYTVNPYDSMFNPEPRVFIVFRMSANMYNAVKHFFCRKTISFTEMKWKRPCQRRSILLNESTVNLEAWAARDQEIGRSIW